MKKTLLEIRLSFVLLISVLLINTALFSLTTKQGQIKPGVDLVFWNAKNISYE